MKENPFVPQNNTTVIVIVEVKNKDIANKFYGGINKNIALRVELPGEEKNEETSSFFNITSCKKKNEWGVKGKQIQKSTSIKMSQKELIDIISNLNFIVEAQNRNGAVFLSKIENFFVKFKFEDTKKEITLKKQQCHISC